MRLALILALFCISNLCSQDDCNVLFEDFNNYQAFNSGGPGKVSQSQGDWLYYDSSAGDGDIYEWGDTTIRNYVNIPSTVFQG